MFMEIVMRCLLILLSCLANLAFFLAIGNLFRSKGE